jgi:alpha-beta hydrolase superfamily lysophospholipase
VAAAAGLVFAFGPRVTVDTEVAAPQVPSLDSLELWLAAAEAQVPGLRPGAERTIVWADPSEPGRTSLAVVYLHGFSATRREAAPLADSVAAALGANLHYARLRGHGRDGEALADATAEDWLTDAAEALAVGRRLGDRVVLVGTSTGATLALYAAARLPGADDVAAVVALSPNFGPANRAAGMLLWPWGHAIARLLLGPVRSWEPANEQQALWRTTVYPTRALLPMMALVALVDADVLADVTVPTLVLYSADDEVVDRGAIRSRSARLGGRPVVIETVDLAVGDPSHHVLAGDVLSPATTVPLARRIVTFLAPLERDER